MSSRSVKTTDHVETSRDSPRQNVATTKTDTGGWSQVGYTATMWSRARAVTANPRAHFADLFRMPHCHGRLAWARGNGRRGRPRRGWVRRGTSAPRRRGLLVLGMHRSGTSALTRTLNLVGAQLPSRLLEARVDNVTGYWESADLTAIHDRVLESAGTSWEDFARIPASWHTSDVAESFRREILAVLERDFATSPLFVIKDPRICRLVPLWTSVLERFGVEAAFLIAFRNPIEVAESLKARDDLHPAKALLMWLRHVIDAERGSRGARRVLVSYEALLQDWRAVVRRVGRELGLEWPGLSHTADAAVEAFLDRRMRHQQSTLDEVRRRPEVLDWARSLYEALVSAEEGSSSNLSEVVDSIGAQLDLADRAFGPLIADFDTRLAQAHASLGQAGSSLAAAHAGIEVQEADRGRLREELAEARVAFGARAEQRVRPSSRPEALSPPLTPGSKSRRRIAAACARSWPRPGREPTASRTRWRPAPRGTGRTRTASSTSSATCPPSARSGSGRSAPWRTSWRRRRGTSPRRPPRRGRPTARSSTRTPPSPVCGERAGAGRGPRRGARAGGPPGAGDRLAAGPGRAPGSRPPGSPRQHPLAAHTAAPERAPRIAAPHDAGLLGGAVRPARRHSPPASEAAGVVAGPPRRPLGREVRAVRRAVVPGAERRRRRRGSRSLLALPPATAPARAATRTRCSTRRGISSRTRTSPPQAPTRSPTSCVAEAPRAAPRTRCSPTPRSTSSATPTSPRPASTRSPTTRPRGHRGLRPTSPVRHESLPAGQSRRGGGGSESPRALRAPRPTGGALPGQRGPHGGGRAASGRRSRAGGTNWPRRGGARPPLPHPRGVARPVLGLRATAGAEGR